MCMQVLDRPDHLGSSGAFWQHWKKNSNADSLLEEEGLPTIEQQSTTQTSNKRIKNQDEEYKRDTISFVQCSVPVPGYELDPAVRLLGHPRRRRVGFVSWNFHLFSVVNLTCSTSGRWTCFVVDDPALTHTQPVPVHACTHTSASYCVAYAVLFRVVLVLYFHE